MTRRSRPVPEPGARRRAAAVLLAGLALATAAHGAGLLSMTGPIDRRSDSLSWCSSENLPTTPSTDYPSVPFVADGPEATIEFIAANLDSGIYWTNQKIDNVCVVERAAFDTWFQDSSACTPCAIDGNLGFDIMPNGQIVYLETFDFGTGSWDVSGGAFWSTAAAPRLPNGACDATGGSLGLGLSTGPDTVRTSVTIGGLTPGTEYVVTYWWTYIGDANVTDGELAVEVWGTEPWKDVTPQPMLQPAAGRGGAWGDFDGDGDPDLYATSFGVPNRLYRNDGVLDFADVTQAVMADTGNAFGVAWVDPDEDGDRDLFLANAVLGTNRFLENDMGTFVDVAVPVLLGGGATTGAPWADYDLDGDLDLYLVDFSGANVLIRNDGDSVVAVPAGVLEDPSAGLSAAWSDYDLDGDPDLYLVNEAAANRLFRNEGGGVFSDVSAAPVNDAGDGSHALWADFDDDGDPDLFLANQTGEIRFYENTAGSFSTRFSFNEITAWGATAADWDLDGDVDVALAREGPGNRVWRNDGGWSFTQTAGGPFPMSARDATIGLSFADYDLDGDPDLFVANDDGEIDRLLRNDQAEGNHWLQVDLEGDVSNPMGLGARIRVVAGSLDRTREVTDGTAFTAQNEVRVTFGLGKEPAIDSITVFWPSGIVQGVTPPPVDSRILVQESSVTGAAVSTITAPGRWRLEAARPNPFRAETGITYELPAGSAVSLRVYDVTGRLVRRLDEGPRRAGVHRVVWDGADRSDVAVAPGIYFLRLQAGDRALVRRVVRLR